MKDFEHFNRMDSLVSRTTLDQFIESFLSIRRELESEGFERSDVHQYLISIMKSNKHLYERNSMIKLSKIIREMPDQESNGTGGSKDIILAFQEAFKNHLVNMRDSYSASDYESAETEFTSLSRSMRNIEDVVELSMALGQEDYLDSYITDLANLDPQSQRQVIRNLAGMVQSHLKEISEVLQDITGFEQYKQDVRTTY